MDKIVYSARAISSVTMITLNLSDLQDIMLRRKDLKKRIDNVVNQYTDMEAKPMLDFTRTYFCQDWIESKERGEVDRHGNIRNDYKPAPGKYIKTLKLVRSVERLCAYRRYQQ